ncbi:M48 family metallopeptidase [Tenggerimyces flavus]|uniref:M48 family metallopeptidase n=1 Tax=Tenggerimyces flavus TaxID=1708749 RepID=A0ABV7YA42_9ACTN|nr:M48 family metallopeptidase [Tenggerimyces flavus]MBM7783768.1 Zn-dependent protease with chaperone function [Tenggerimyces flavus]
MKTGLRASTAIAMLVGFYVFALAVVAGLVGLCWLIFLKLPSNLLVGKLIWVIGGAGVLVLWGLVKSLRLPPFEPFGVRVTPEEQPELWALVRELAAQVQTKAPDEIWLDSDVNAGVTEQTRLLGLIGGRRYLTIGTPLLTALTVDQLRAVLAHELGHYSESHTKLLALSYRGRSTVIRTIGQLRSGNIVRWLLVQYAKLYFLVESAVSRQQELEADQASARIAGRTAAQTALREVSVINAAWNFYLENYVGWALDYGVAPRGVVRGFVPFLQGRADQLSELRSKEVEDQASRWDSHPSHAVRIAALADAPELGGASDSRPATAVLGAPDELFDRVEQVAFDFGSRERLDWDGYVTRGALASAQTFADALYRGLTRLGGEASFDTVLSYAAEGRLPELREQLASVNAPHDFGAVVTAAALRGGVVTAKQRWDQSLELVYVSDGSAYSADEFEELLEDCQAGVDTFVRRLAERGIELDAGAVVKASADAQTANVLAALANFKVDRKNMDLLVTDEGLVFVPAPRSTDNGDVRLQKLLDSAPVAEIAARSNSLWIPYEEVRGGEVLRKLPMKVRLDRHGKDPVELRQVLTGDALGNSQETFVGVMGELVQRGVAVPTT